jgi:hypothetical protein
VGMSDFLAVVLPMTGTLVHVYRDKQPRTVGRMAEIFLLWFLVSGTGLGVTWAFVGHMFLGDQEPGK